MLPVDAHTRELLDLITRWIHLIAGIMWVGNSMLFNWLDRNLVKRAGADERHVGDIWMVHSGGFYQVEKKFLAPSQMPEVLHWFKWQAYTTWMSSIALLVLVYYMGGGALLIDPNVSSMTPTTATAVGLVTVFGGLAVYDLLWRSPLATKAEGATTVLSLALLGGAVYWLTTQLSGRGAYIHVGALLGTCMAGNVFLHIIPSQRELVAATTSGRDQDPKLSWRAKQRSIHNNYMTFPLLFLMLSSHFPSTFGHAHRALVLGVLMVAGAGVRHVLNIRFGFPQWKPALAAVIGGAVAVLYVLLVPHAKAENTAIAAGPPVDFATVRTVLQQRCMSCHSTTPKDAVFTTAPNGVIFDSPEQIKMYADRIMARAVTAKNMPLANRTNMTDDERLTLGRWIAQGAKIDK